MKVRLAVTKITQQAMRREGEETRVYWDIELRTLQPPHGTVNLRTETAPEWQLHDAVVGEFTKTKE